jgi:uncharacterized protein (DUF433 family)
MAPGFNNFPRDGCATFWLAQSGLQFGCAAVRLPNRPGTRTVPTNGMKKKANGKPRRLELGEHIVADPLICHGKPTFKGTRIMLWQVLDDVADGHSWDFICNVRWGGRLPLAAVAEAVKLARRALLDEHGRLLRAA